MTGLRCFAVTICWLAASAPALGAEPEANSAAPAVGQETSNSSEGASRSSDAGPLVIWISPRHASVSGEQLRGALASELERAVVQETNAGAAQLRVRFESKLRATVSYITPEGEELSRAVDIPPEPERAEQVLVWVAVNLVRDEAGELLRELRARRESASDGAPVSGAPQEPAKPAPPAAPPATPPSPSAAAPKPGGDSRSNADDLLRAPHKRLDLALFTPISLLPDSARRELFMGLALAYADVGALRGPALAVGALRLRRDLRGAALTVGALLIAGSARGVAASVGYTHVAGDVEGAGLGVGAAYVGGHTRGAVVAAGAAVAHDVEGAVAAAGVSSAESLRGVSAAAGVNWLRAPSEGIVLAGGVNVTSDLRGFVAAAGINVNREVTGFALAPLNVQQRVRGFQLGVLNISEEVDGAALGVVSIAKNGRVQPTLWSADENTAYLGVKSIAGFAFSQLGAGIDFGAEHFSYEGGAGGHIRLGPRYFLEPGIHYSHVQDVNRADQAALRHDLHYLVTGGWRLGDKLDLLLSLGLRHTVAGETAGHVRPAGRLGVALF